jgi:hypothetical protein
MTVAAGGPIFCFVVLLKSLMTVVKSVSDGLRHWSERLRAETQRNLDRPLRISAGPRHLSRPLSTTSSNDAGAETPTLASQAPHCARALVVHFC